MLLLLLYLSTAVNVYTASGYIEVDSDRTDGKCEKWHMTEIKVKMDNITTKWLNLRYRFAIFLFPDTHSNNTQNLFSLSASAFLNRSASQFRAHVI